MNRTTLSILIAIFFLFFTQSLVTALSCTIRFGGCSSEETCIFKLSDLRNAHAETCSQTNYNYSVCCSESGRALSTSCSEAYDGVIRLSDTTNAHVRDYDLGDGTYPVRICLSSDISTDNVDCVLLSNGDCSSIGYECLASVSASDNAHVGDCNAYSTKICCSITPQTACDVYIKAADIGNTGYLINESNKVYCLEENVTLTSAITAITFNETVKNSTLDCMGHVIDGNGIDNSVGIEVRHSVGIPGGNNNTVKNCHLRNLDWGIRVYGDYHTISNNYVNNTTTCLEVWNNFGSYIGNKLELCGSSGISVFGGSNEFINNIVTKCRGVCVDAHAAGNNYFEGGTIDRLFTETWAHEYEINNVATNYKFNRTNFSLNVERLIFLDSQGSASFNYSEDGVIWLDTSSPTSGNFFRKLINWSVTNLSWEEWKFNLSDPNPSLFIYNITGLLPNTQYYIHNNSQLYEIKTSSPTGSLEFNLTIPGDGSHQLIEVSTTAPPCTYALTIDPTSDTKYTTSYNFAINATDASSPTCSSPITYNITYALTGDCQPSTSVSPSFQIEQGSTLSPAFWVNISRGSSSCTVDINVTDPNNNVVATGSYTVSPIQVSDVVITSVYPPRKIVETGETFSLTLTLYNGGSDISTLDIQNVKDSRGVVDIVKNSWSPSSISPFPSDSQTQISVTANSTGRLLTSTVLPIIDAQKDGTQVEIRPVYPIMNLSISKNEIEIGSNEKIRISISPWDMLTNSPLDFSDLSNVKLSFYKFEEEEDMLNLIYQKNLDSPTFDFTLESIGIKGTTNPEACGYYIAVVTGERSGLPSFVGSDSVGFTVTGCLYAG